MVHVGVGAFHRAHQAAYTQRVDDERRWGISAFTGRSAVPPALAEQDGVYTLVVPGQRPQATVIDQLTAVSSGRDRDAFRAAIADEGVAVVTVTVTEAGYLLGDDGRVDPGSAAARADIVALREGRAAQTAPGRLADALNTRRRTGVPLTVVSCDNLSGNGGLLRSAVLAIAAGVDEALADWIRAEVAFPDSVVDRITPAPTPEACRLAEDLTGFEDRAAVLAEAHSEWIIADAFAGDRPAWERAGAVVVHDVAPYELRKLRLLNAAHTFLALEGRLRGHVTVAEAFADPALRRGVDDLWDAAARSIPATTGLDDYRAALAVRFADAAIPHRLDQIAAGSAEKLRTRVIPTIEAERRAGRDGDAGLRAVAAFLATEAGTDLPSAVSRLHAPWATDDTVMTTLRDRAARAARLPTTHR
ncbi:MULTISPECIES: mannitol dehydrogenase family protein [Microbacterium]|jgi:fructuronate reductase|uniref:mannitol dehydrogenase family protein n=1 Tax=Microbacterium TaxID=33882 RepID=UPI002260B5CE|nr:mannitol dehydrogenase family protein [Microbacterium testaceum]